MEQLRNSLEDTHIRSIEPIRSPVQLKTDIVNRNPNLVVKTRQEIRNILHGQDTSRLLIIVGPCSIHDPQAAMEYAQRLTNLRNELAEELVIVMRTYPEKPRTTVGWTGLAYSPNLNGSSEEGSSGVAITRQLLADINYLGVPCGVEFLDPYTPQYYADLVSWAAIGARTTESQTHRQLASGLSMPVGFKNSTEGKVKIATDAMIAAASNHTFYSINVYGQLSLVTTTGNPDTHLILRGSNEGTNYDKPSVGTTVNLLQKAGLLTESNRPVMVDCSHGNSEKDYTKQPAVFGNILEQIAAGQRRIIGMMLESNLQAGNQKYTADQPLKYGVSITDGCIDWEETRNLLLNSARIIYPRRYVLT